MHPILAWCLGAAFIGYRYGYKCNMLPTPRRFIMLTAFISIASLVSSANQTAGALFAYGSLLAMYFQQQGKPAPCDKLTPSSSSSGNSGSAQTPSPAPGPATPNAPGMPQPAPGPL